MTLAGERVGRLLPARPENRADHRGRHGELRWTGSAAQLLDLIEAGGLRGRGGGGFPLARKLRAIGPGRPVVVANGCEGDPLSRKDEALLCLAPHLVLDGLALAAFAVGADTAYLCLHEGSPAEAGLIAALSERPDDPVPARPVRVPQRFVASEESALVNFLGTGRARPLTTPPRPTERGVRGRPTVVSNVETLAQLAVLARVGPETYRRTGTSLFTISGAVRSPGVYELPHGPRLEELLHAAGGYGSSAVLIGGCGGRWVPLPAGLGQVLSVEATRAAGLQLGPAALVALAADACGLAETARILRYLADQSAGQCGPCLFGLPAIAQDFHDIAADRAGTGGRAAWIRLQRRLPVIAGRGACAHPDGAIGLATSALRVFGADLAAHRRGYCLHARRRR
ncbi:MAG TPA: NADH-ubiquinone oxidoreductase-F iron-sulfur binding region domain-containing protein [Mycobacteriales bacterium]|nr:NADH-ubiquinone oxidoreductase-F iron-sulfur binding region domain-containing protein [Mycobacteriales bacterium]